MMSQRFSLLLITAVSSLAETVAEVLAAEQGLVLLDTMTVAEALSTLPAPHPDLILLAVAEWERTAVFSHFPHTPIMLILDKASQPSPPNTPAFIFSDALSNPLLPRLLSSYIQLAQQETTKQIEQQQRELAESLSAVGIQLNSTLDFDRLLDYILEQLELFLPYDMAAIHMIDGDTSRIVRLRVPERNELLDQIVQRASTLSFPIPETQNLQTILRTRQPLVISDLNTYPEWIYYKDRTLIRSWIGAPLILQGAIIGIISLDKSESNYYKAEHKSILATFATQAATALQNSRIHKENKRKIAELSVLHALAGVSSDALDVDDLLTRCTHIVSDLLYPDSFGFVLVNRDGTMSTHHAFHNRLPTIHLEKLPMGSGVVGQVILTGQLKRISDVRDEADYKDIVAHTHSELCVPLYVEGKVIGAINAESIFYDAFSETDEQFLVTLSQQIATAIERMQLIKAERNRHQETAVLQKAAHSLSFSLDLEQVLTNILNHLEDVVPYKSASVMLLHEEKLTIVAAQGFRLLSNIVGQTLPATNPLLAQVLASKRPLCLADVQESPYFEKRKTSYTIRAWICLPLIVHDQILGVLTVDHTEVGAFSDNETRLAQSFANYAAIAIENARLYTSEQQARKTAEMMRESHAMLMQSLDLDTILSTLLTYLQLMIPLDRIQIWFIEGEFAQVYEPGSGKAKPPDEGELDTRIQFKTSALLQEMFLSQEGLIIADGQTNGRLTLFAPHHPAPFPPGSWMGIPIITGGKALGFFTIENARPAFFNNQHLQVAQYLTNQAAILIQNAQLLQETRQRAAELEAIATLSAALRETVEVEVLLKIILEKMLQLVNGTYGSIYLIEPETGRLVRRSTQPYHPELIGFSQSINEGISGFVVRTGRIHIADDIRKDPLLLALPEEDQFLQAMRTSINLPLRTQERIIGVLHVNLDKSHTFTDTEIKLLTAVSEIAGTAIDRALVLDTLEQRVVLRTRELAQANDRLTELDRLKTKFISDISHELRTPITNLSLYLDLLEKGKSERREQYTAVLRRQVNRLITMIEDILNISRLDMGKTILTLAPLNVNKVVQQVVAANTYHPDDTLILSTDLQLDLPPIMSDERQLAQILANLLNNALSYTHKGKIHITTRWLEAQNQVCIAVADTGIGIPPLELTHVSERFYRASNVSQSTMPGTGLGLSLVKELVDMHQGHMEITSELNKGTRVALYLPVNSEQYAMNSEPTSDHQLKTKNKKEL